MFYVTLVNDAGCVLSREKFSSMMDAQFYIMRELFPSLCIGDTIKIED